MPAYMIFLRESPPHDTAALAEYSRLNRENAASMAGKYKLTPLVVYGEFEMLEGDPVDGAIILQFPSMDEARAWYNSPEYQLALPHRLKGADYRAILVEGLPTG